MKKIPKTKHSLMIRTDFSDDQLWESLCAAAQAENDDGFRAVFAMSK